MIARKVEIEYERLLVGAVIFAHIPSLTAGTVRRDVTPASRGGLGGRIPRVRGKAPARLILADAPPVVASGIFSPARRKKARPRKPVRFGLPGRLASRFATASVPG
ncbi:MAG: hypothetical protein WDM84_07560 [Bauldia sp.]